MEWSHGAIIGGLECEIPELPSELTYIPDRELGQGYYRVQSRSAGDDSSCFPWVRSCEAGTDQQAMAPAEEHATKEGCEARKERKRRAAAKKKRSRTQRRIWSDTISLHKEEIQTLQAKRDTLQAPIKATQKAIVFYEGEARPSTSTTAEEQDEARDMVNIHQAELANLLSELTKHTAEKARREGQAEHLQSRLESIDPTSLASEESTEDQEEEEDDKGAGPEAEPSERAENDEDKTDDGKLAPEVQTAQPLAGSNVDQGDKAEEAATGQKPALDAKEEQPKEKEDTRQEGADHHVEESAVKLGTRPKAGWPSQAITGPPPKQGSDIGKTEDQRKMPEQKCDETCKVADDKVTVKDGEAVVKGIESGAKHPQDTA